MTGWEEDERFFFRGLEAAGRARKRGAPRGVKRERAHGGCLWLPEAKKGAAGGDIPRGGASSL